MPELWEQHVAIAKNAAVKYCRTRPHLNLDDVIQECLIVLYKAQLNFDPKRGGHFGRYAKVSINLHLISFWKGHVKYRPTVSLDEPIRVTEEGDELSRGQVYDEAEGRQQASSRALDNLLSRIAEIQEFILTGETLTDLERDVLTLHFLDDIPLYTVAARLKQSRREVQVARVAALKKARDYFREKGLKVATGKITVYPSDNRDDIKLEKISVGRKKLAREVISVGELTYA
jgi:RNA polymerase sigma factor (sigma-70 family)